MAWLGVSEVVSKSHCESLQLNNLSSPLADYQIVWFFRINTRDQEGDGRKDLIFDLTPQISKFTDKLEPLLLQYYQQ